MLSRRWLGWLALAWICTVALTSLRRIEAADVIAAPPLVGRWDLTVTGGAGEFPSWLEVRVSGTKTLVGSYVGQFGSARPISKVEVDKSAFSFTIPPQWEKRDHDQTFRGTCTGTEIHGSTTDDNGKPIHFIGVRAPSLARSAAPVWGEPIELVNGRDLSGWKPMFSKVANGWVVRDGALYNEKPGNNLVTEQTFQDFQLHVEFRYPAKSNSGIYLRGRYEVQIEDNYGDEAESHKIGGIYGFLSPCVNAGKPAGEWQSYDVTLVGRTVSVSLNGERVIDRQVIPGITGGAIDSHEGEPGPLYIQGDHGPVEFRKITIIPAKL